MVMSGLLTGADYVQALRLRRQLAAEVDGVLGRYDVLVTASGWTPAPELGRVPKFYLFEKPLLTPAFDAPGHPAITAFKGFLPGGLPVGMQNVDAAFAEATVPRVGPRTNQAAVHT